MLLILSWITITIPILFLSVILYKEIHKGNALAVATAITLMFILFLITFLSAVFYILFYYFPTGGKLL
jgi:phosphatidylserine synthase